MARIPEDMQVIDESSVKRVAHVIGTSSAAQAALDDAAAMRARGANPAFGYSKAHSCFFVFDIGQV